MFKKICLFLTFSTLPIIASHEVTREMPTFKDQVTHIVQEKQSLMLDLKKIFTLFKKAVEYQQSILGSAYQSLAQQIQKTLVDIVNSEEFNRSLDEMTDYQTEQIVHNGVRFNDIIYENVILTYSINRKIEAELTKAFPSLDQQTEQLFNIFYVTIATYRGTMMLIEKLTDKEKAITQKIHDLASSDDTINQEIAS